MEIIFQLILVAGIIKYSCKATFFRGYRGIITYTILSGIFAFTCYPFIVKTNSNVFNQLLTDKTSVSNIAILITIEAISGMFISIGMLQNLSETKLKKSIKAFKLIPGIIIMGIIFYVELSLFRTMAGSSFITIAIVSALLCMLVIAILSIGIKILLPDFSSRFELKFLVNLILFVLAVLLNAGLADYNTGNYSSDIEYKNLLVFVLLVITGFILGFLWYRNKHIINKILKNK